MDGTKKAKPARDTQWLEQRRGGWYAVVYVPPKLHDRLGKKLRASLKTRDLREAQILRHPKIAEFKRLIREAERMRPDDRQIEEALRWRQDLEAAKQGELKGYSPEFIEGPDGETLEVAAESVVTSYITDRIEQIAEKAGEDRAAEFAGIAFGTKTPLMLHVKTWLSEGGQKGSYEPKTKVQLERDVAELESWLKSTGIPAVIEAVNRRVAGRFISEHLAKSGRTRKTLARIISACRSYWVWLGRRGFAAEDRTPWDRQAPPKDWRDDVEDKGRPFSDAEVVTLLNGPADLEMHDLMRVAALSGMRIDEPYRLTVADCADGVFKLRKAKTKAGVRVIPIHSDLAAIVERRTKGKDPGAWLFPEPGEKAPGRPRSSPASQRFQHYREKLGITEDVAGKRNSLVVFHSFRKWFCTKAEDAHVTDYTVQQIIGQKPQTLLKVAYTGPSPIDILRKGVEAVKLPAGALLDPLLVVGGEHKPRRRRRPVEAR